MYKNKNNHEISLLNAKIRGNNFHKNEKRKNPCGHSGTPQRDQNVRRPEMSVIDFSV